VEWGLALGEVVTWGGWGPCKWLQANGAFRWPSDQARDDSGLAHAWPGADRGL